MKKSAIPHPLTPHIGKIIRFYSRDKRALSNGWHAGKFLGIKRGKAQVELKHITLVPIGDCEIVEGK